jgi:hypothetical protein
MRKLLVSSSPALVAIALFGIIVLGPSRAQQPATQPKAPAKAPAKAAPKAQPKDEDKPLIFSTGARLVVADVTVKDKNGNTVNGLKKSDFAIFEDNAKQNVEVFEPQVLT